MIHLRLVRHGQSTWNESGRLQGQVIDVPLTELGIVQARQAADVLVNFPATHLFTSDQHRALHTAEIIGDRLGLTPILTTDLREQGRGELEGRTVASMQPEPIPAGLDITEVRWGSGENVPDVMTRLARFIAEVRRSRASHVIAVTHGDAMCIFAALLAGRSHRDVDWTLTKNGGVLSFDLPRSPIGDQI